MRRGDGRRPAAHPGAGCAPARRARRRPPRSRPRPAPPHRSARDRRRSTPRGGRARRGRRTSTPPAPPGCRVTVADWIIGQATSCWSRSPGRLAPGIDPAGVAVARPQQLHRVGGEAGGTLEAAVRDPGVRAALRQVLPAHHHRPAARVTGDVVVDVLRGVGLVVHDEAAIAQAEVLHEDRVARDRRRRRCWRPRRARARAAARGCSQSETRCRRPPVSPSQTKRSAAAPNATSRAGADRLARPPARARRTRRIQARDPAVQRRARHLVDQRAAALVPVLDGEDATVRQDADREAGRARDAEEAEVALAGRLEGAGGGGRHRWSPVSGRRRSAGGGTAATLDPRRRQRTPQGPSRQPPPVEAARERRGPTGQRHDPSRPSALRRATGGRAVPWAGSPLVLRAPPTVAQSARKRRARPLAFPTAPFRRGSAGRRSGPPRPAPGRGKRSGTSRDGRSELRLLLDFLHAGGTLLATRIDRLARPDK